MFFNFQGDGNHDIQVFALATLLSSVLIYNVLGALNEDTFAKLQYPLQIFQPDLIQT